MPQEAGLAAEVLGWRLLGTYVWHGGLVWAATILSELILPVSFASIKQASSIALLVLLYGLQCIVLAAHRAVLSPNEFEPIVFPKAGIHGRSWVSLLLTRVLARGKSLASLISVAALIGSTLLCGGAYAALYGRLRVGSTAPAAYTFCFATALALVHSLSHLLG